MLVDNCERVEGPMSDLFSSPSKQSESRNPKQGSQKTKANKRRDQSYVVRDMITCLALCHNVTPVYEDENDPSTKEF